MGIPRFVAASNYADSFGMQWNHFAKTQLDSHSGTNISANRFWNATGWERTELIGKWVLDAGCGSGRFAQIALDAGANVVALDYSTAVDACLDNLGRHPRLSVVQGDIYRLPFAPRSFDYVYSLGVLQHTPDVRTAFRALADMVAPGGRLCVDYYEKSFAALLHPKYLLRPVTRRLNKRRLFELVHAAVPYLLPASNAAGRVPGAGRALRRLVPVANYDGILPLNDAQLHDWALLDTFDWLSPAYDNPQTAATAERWFAESCFTDIEVIKAGHLVARGRRPG